MNEEKKRMGTEDLWKELLKAIDLANSVKQFSEADHGEKVIDNIFEKSIEIEGGTITMLISIENIPPKELMTVMNSLQNMSDELLNKEIPKNITK